MITEKPLFEKKILEVYILQERIWKDACRHKTLQLHYGNPRERKYAVD
jgi:hypothetical protein